jgi:hypothetical protein
MMWMDFFQKWGIEDLGEGTEETTRDALSLAAFLAFLHASGGIPNLPIAGARRATLFASAINELRWDSA